MVNLTKSPPELAALIADQQRDMLHGHRARDVFDAQAVAFLPGDEMPVYSRRAPLIEIHHGTLYGYKRQGCRCGECRGANADWQRSYVLRRWGSWSNEWRCRTKAGGAA